jgi:hypothetical protein
MTTNSSNCFHEENCCRGAEAPVETSLQNYKYRLDLIYEQGGNWDLPVVDRSMDRSKAEVYIKSLKDDQQRLVTLILDNTRYIPFSEFKTTFVLMLSRLPIKFNLYVSFLRDGLKRKCGSEDWLTMVAWPYIKDRCERVISAKKDFKSLDNDYPVVLLDDCVYSGCNMCATIDNLPRYYGGTVGIKKRVSFIVAVAYSGMKETDQCQLKDFADSIIIGETIPPIIKIQPFIDEICNQMGKGNPSIDDMMDFLYSKLQCESSRVIPMYFDHKIANEFGSFPAIYSQLIKEPTTREKILLLDQLLL